MEEIAAGKPVVDDEAAVPVAVRRAGDAAGAGGTVGQVKPEIFVSQFVPFIIGKDQQFVPDDPDKTICPSIRNSLEILKVPLRLSDGRNSRKYPSIKLA